MRNVNVPIDTEGAELEVLRGPANTIQSPT